MGPSGNPPGKIHPFGVFYGFSAQNTQTTQFFDTRHTPTTPEGIFWAFIFVYFPSPPFYLYFFTYFWTFHKRGNDSSEVPFFVEKHGKNGCDAHLVSFRTISLMILVVRRSLP